MLAGGGQVMDAARQDIRDPQRDAARVEQGLDVPARFVGLPGKPQVNLLALDAGGLLATTVGGEHLAVEDHMGQALGLGST